MKKEILANVVVSGKNKKWSIDFVVNPDIMEKMQDDGLEVGEIVHIETVGPKLGEQITRMIEDAKKHI